MTADDKADDALVDAKNADDKAVGALADATLSLKTIANLGRVCDRPPKRGHTGFHRETDRDQPSAQTGYWIGLVIILITALFLYSLFAAPVQSPPCYLIVRPV
jgi:hypothetical protein